MQLLCKPVGGVLTVMSTHADAQSIDGSLLGVGGLVLPYDGSLGDVELLFKPVPEGAVDLRAYAAAVRYAREIDGITVGNAPIATDRNSQALITGTWAAAQLNPGITIQFKTSAGFVAVGADQVKAIASAVVAHVQACFAKEAEVVGGITAGTMKVLADVDAAFAAVTS